jgi:hypothetical protein
VPPDGAKLCIGFPRTALRKFLHRFELRLAVMAAVALLIAQLGAMSHAYSHDAAIDSPTTHQTGASSHDPCNDCLAYAPLLAAAGASGALPFIEPQGRGLATRATARSLVDLSLTLAFRSRAPPDTL